MLCLAQPPYKLILRRLEIEPVLLGLNLIYSSSLFECR